MKALRTAVIGLGRSGWRFHVPEIVRHEGFDLVAVVDPLQERLDEAKRESGTRGYLDCDALLGSEELDLVVVASPTEFHADQAIAALDRGCDVFCEKPMARTLEEVDRMIALMGKNRRKLMVRQQHRAGAETVALREILRRGLIGPVYMIKRADSAYIRRNDWQAFRAHGGGMLNNYGSHFIDQMLYLSGSQAKRVRCALRTVASVGDADDVVKVVIETRNGITLDVDINMASAYPIPAWHVLGERGGIVMDEERKNWRVLFFRREELSDIRAQGGLAARDRSYETGEAIPWHEEIVSISDFEPVDFYEKCYQYFALDKEPFVPVAESRELMRVLEACRKDAGKDDGIQVSWKREEDGR